MTYQHFQLDTAPNGICVVTFDMQASSVNTLCKAVALEAVALFKQLATDRQVKAVVLWSGKTDSFVVGADVHELAACTSSQQAKELAQFGQNAMQTLADLHERHGKPVLAAVHGAALGGGLELLLACSARLASDASCTRFALPEVNLGLIPGAGGTQRLPAVVGVQAALDLILSGRSLSAHKALAVGLVQEVLPASQLLSLAKTRAEQSLQHAFGSDGKKNDLPSHFRQRVGKLFSWHFWQHLALEDNKVGLQLLFKQASAKIRQKTQGHYPAPIQALKAVRTGLLEGMEAGLACEAEWFGQLSQSKECKALMQLFFHNQALKKEASEAAQRAQPLRQIGVIGGGLMGSGIASVSAQNAALNVRLKDVDTFALNRALEQIATQIGKNAKRKRWSQFETDRVLRRVSVTSDFSGMRRAQVVIEAVFEDLPLKQQILADVEAQCSEHTIFASNTSAIPIADIAAHAKHPQRVIGMHYFSPVEKMPLLEIIVTDQTDAEVIATCTDLGQKQGKTVIVVGDGVGFYTTRVLTPYMAEAAWLLGEGAAIQDIDQAAMQFGFPVGPMTLLDEVGMDVGAKVMFMMERTFGERIKAPTLLKELLVSGRRGRKNGQGFYSYKGGKKGQADSSIYQLIGQDSTRKAFAVDQIQRRLVLSMANEAVRCLQDGILRSPRDGDIGAVMGLGFPPFLGGPFAYIDHIGCSQCVDQLHALANEFGSRFEPTVLLSDMAKTNQRFFAAV